jgi:hypothetical protein
MLFTEWNLDDALEVAREESRQYVLDMINQGLTIEEIKERLNQGEIFTHL